MRRLLTGLVLSTALAAASADLERARRLYESTDYEGSLKILHALPSKDAVAWEWTGKNLYMLGEFKRAVEAFQRAVNLAPEKASLHLWLGRAWGRRAETANVFLAPSYAAKARQSFERAVALDPANKEAASDLFSYYLEAPGFLGGGLDKAEALARRIYELDPAEYHFAMAKIAEKRKQTPLVEQQLRRAAELAPKQVGRLVDLAKFLAGQGRFSESDAAFRQAETIDPDDPGLLFERARSLIQAKRDLETARSLLRRFLASPLTPEHPSRAEAQKLLRQADGV